MSKASQVTKKHTNPNASFGGGNKPKEEAPKVEPIVDKEEIDVSSIVDDFYEKQSNKELKQDTSGNYTLVINHDIMERLDFLAEHYKRGFKSELVNEALETFVSLYEKKPLPPKRKKKGRSK